MSAKKSKSKPVGFVPLHVRVHPHIPFCKTVWIKEHHAKGADAERLPSKRTLFVLNVDHATEASVRAIFEDFGEVERVEVGSTDGHQKVHRDAEDEALTKGKIEAGHVSTVHVVFMEEDGLRQALSHGMSSSAEPIDTAGEGEDGIATWVAEHRARYRDPRQLKEEIEAAMAEYDRMEELERLERLKPKVDEDGFTLVQSKSTRKRLAESDAPEAKRVSRRKKKKDPVHLDFYKFQAREAKRDELAALRKKFEADKEKIANMKAKRKFRPD